MLPLNHFLGISQKEPLTHGDAAPSGHAARANGVGHDAAVPRAAERASAAPHKK